MKCLLNRSIIVLLILVGAGCKKNVLDIEMVYISGGMFLMGSEQEEADQDERPIHEVYVRDFYLGKYEVTQAQWKAVMMRNPSYKRHPNLPVESVSWDECQQFINRLNKLTGKQYRLPTEEEWEYVAYRGFQSVQQNEMPLYAWCKDSYEEQTRTNLVSHKVGMLRPNKLGIYDQIGNVHEWCANSYDSLSYIHGITHDNDEKVFRGGCFLSENKYIRLANRNHTHRDTRHYTLWLRLAMDVLERTESGK